MAGDKWQELNSGPDRIGQPAQTPRPQPLAEPPQQPQQRDTGLSTAAKAGFTAAAIAVLGVSGFIAFGGGESDTDTSSDATATDTVLQNDVAENEQAEGDSAGDVESGELAFTEDDDSVSETDPATTDDVTSEDVDSQENSSEDVTTNDENEVDSDNSSAANLDDPDSPLSPPGAPTNHSILANGKLYLRGTLPSQEIADAITAAVVPVMGGEDNVVNQYAIDPSVDFTPGQSTPTYVADAVLFQTNSAEIDPQFFPLLQLGVVLLQLQPNVTNEAIGHTDSQGDDAANLRLSQARVDAWQAWMVSQGIDPARLTATGKGETEPRVSNNTEEGRQLNRRLEFIITGFEF